MLNARALMAGVARVWCTPRDLPGAAELVPQHELLQLDRPAPTQIVLRRFYTEI